MMHTENDSKIKELTPKQHKFYLKYLATGETVTSYRYAYNAENQTDRTVRRNAQTLLKKPAIASRLKAHRDRLEKSTDIDAEFLLRRLAGIDMMDVADILTDSGDIKPITEWPKVWRTTISGLDVSAIAGGQTEVILKKIKWPDKLKNLEMMGKHIDVQAWLDKKEKKHTHIYEDMSDDDLKSRLAELQAENARSTH